MRRRERTYFLLLGSSSAFALLAGAWPVPLIVFALLELAWSGAEHVASARRFVSYRSETALARRRPETAGGILRTAP